MQVGADNDWAHVVAGSGRSFAIKADGTLWAWGSNSNYALGLGDQDARTEPTKVNDDTDWVAVDSQGNNGSTFALKADGTLWAWGWNGYGQLGLGTYDTVIDTPGLVDSDGEWVAVSADHSYAMGVKADGTLWGWGSNTGGQLGLGSGQSIVFWAPTRLLTGEWSVEHWHAISAGSSYSHAIALDGTLWAWGDNGYAMLGDGTTDRRRTPVQIGDAADW